MPVREEPQTHMEEEVVLDPTLLGHLETWIETKEEAKKHREASAAIKALMKDRPPGLYRCGTFQIERKISSGGGFMLETWEGPVNRIRALD